MANTTPSDLPEVIATETPQATTEIDAGAGKHVEPELFGLAPFQIVSIAMLVLLLFAFFGAKVHKTIAGGLDNKIASIKEQLEEAKQLRAEAEALRKEYADKIAGAEKDAEAMLVNAQTEADAILEKAEADSKAMVERRKRMAEDKIAAAEREAVEEVRNRAVSAATGASRKLIAEKHDAEADRALADKVIAGI
ncbi:ATP synthase subunit B [Erythrobacter sp. SD-21]|uniref:F0F1 ATP synthase subunit B family protein n=1 Tax=Erythrobacter sp. SD-21 TaxID=161528 RepID=UPI000153F749|nr:ATP synthase subunit B [Erythrobacter sp. SD-21]EDL50537.1 AtpF, ATP synthase F0, B subunit [Erythrobacter sp. SD-21]